MVIRHYGQYLTFIGRIGKEESYRIESLLNQKKETLKKLRKLEAEIKEKEKDFYELIKNDWTSEEIEEAKEKAKEEAKRFSKLWNILEKKIEKGRL